MSGDEAERAAVEAAVGQAVVAIERLGGMTNRNFRVRTADGQLLAVRLPGAGSAAYIDRAAERHNAERAAALGLNCPLIRIDADGTMVSHFMDGAVLSPERLQGDRAVLSRAARLLRRVHTEA